MLKIVIGDRNAELVHALKGVFEDYLDVEVAAGDYLELAGRFLPEAWVTPTNSRGSMSGGIDKAVAGHYARSAVAIEPALQFRIRTEHGGVLPIGRAVVIDAQELLADAAFGVVRPRFLIATPTMVGDRDDLRRTKNTARAIAAAFQAIYEANGLAAGEDGEEDPAMTPDEVRRIKTVLMPGLGTGTGRVSPQIGAELMLTGYKLFRRGFFPRWEDLDAALAEVLAESALPNAAAVAAISIDLPL